MTIAEVSKSLVVLSVLAQVVLIVVWLQAHRRYRHKSFAMALGANAFLLAYTLLASAGWFVPLSQDVATRLYCVGLLCAFPGMVLAAWGAVSLVRLLADSGFQPKLPEEKQATGKWGPP